MSDTLELVTVAPSPARLRAYLALSKPRISGMVLVATAMGFYLALPAGAGGNAFPGLIHTLLGVALVAFAANALNQLVEAGLDGKMLRTQDRPIPSGQLSPFEVLVLGVGASIVGLVYLAVFLNVLSSLLAAATLGIYLFAYTPLKRVTPKCVFFGAVSGALPPVIGWTGAVGSLGPGAWVLFGILFFWQLPHFAAIAWLYREDYARAGYRMLPVVDPGGSLTTFHLVTHTVGLLFASVLPVIGGLAGGVYGIGAILLGLAFFGCGVFFVAHKTSNSARFLVLASVTYLPSLFILMMIDKVNA